MVVTRWGARFMRRRFPCAIGRGGMTDAKREGDGATPTGVWHIVSAGFRPDRRAPPAHAPLALSPLGPHDLWSDDSADPHYNHALFALDHRFSHERLRRADPLYDLVLFSDWNWPDASPGHGSAIFVHAWRRPRYPTAGCIAFRPDHLFWIAEHWTDRSRIIVRR